MLPRPPTVVWREVPLASGTSFPLASCCTLPRRKGDSPVSHLEHNLLAQPEQYVGSAVGSSNDNGFGQPARADSHEHCATVDPKRLANLRGRNVFGVKVFLRCRHEFPRLKYFGTGIRVAQPQQTGLDTNTGTPQA